MGVICVQLWTETNDVTQIVGTETEKCALFRRPLLLQN